MILLQPAQPLAMRTIREHAGQIAALRPADELADAIEQIVRAREIADGFGRGVNYHALDFLNDRQFASRIHRLALDLKVTRAMIKKLREIIFRSAPGQRVLPPGFTAS